MAKQEDKVNTFENALDRLEGIIAILQEGNLTLDESLKAFEEGIQLIRICQEKLDNAESKVAILLKDCNGSLNEVPFNIGTEV